MDGRSIIFRADAGSESGMGHFMRCLAMAQMLKDSYACSFVTFDLNSFSEKLLAKEGIAHIIAEHRESSYDNFYDILAAIPLKQKPLVVLDGYAFDKEYVAKIRSLKFPVVYIDDLVRPLPADAIINPSDAVEPSSYPQQDETLVYTGHNYALLRQAFIRAAKEPAGEPDKKVANILLCMGASDPENILSRLIPIIERVDRCTIHLVTASINKNIEALTAYVGQRKDLKLYIDLDEKPFLDLIISCNLAICSASTIAQECCCAGIPLACLQTADNQKGIYEALEKNGLCFGLGEANKLSDDILAGKLRTILAQPERYKTQVIKQKEWYDGSSALRIKEIVDALC